MTNRSNHCTAIVLSGGQGKRMGSNIAKQYLELNGKPIIWYSMAAMQKSEFIDDIVLVIRPEDETLVMNEVLNDNSFIKPVRIAYAGNERYESVWNGLKLIFDDSAPKPDYVFIHDGARPFVSEEIIKRNYEGVIEHGACVSAVKSKDTVKIVDEDGCIISTPDRNTVWNMQTPQSFEAQLIYSAYKKAIESKKTYFTDDAMMVEEFTDKSVFVALGDYRNIKITTPDDLLSAENFFNK